jgi:hypothetical protein
VDRPHRPSCTYRGLIGSIGWWCRKTPWVWRGHISPFKSPPRSFGILNPPTHLELPHSLKSTLVDSQSRRASIRQPRRTPLLGDYDRRSSSRYVKTRQKVQSGPTTPTHTVTVTSSLMGTTRYCQYCMAPMSPNGGGRYITCHPSRLDDLLPHPHHRSHHP